MLKTEMLKLRDDYGLELEHTGFERREISRLRMDIADTPKDEDVMPEESQVVVSREGDLWILGDHRLICGSSTKPETVARVLLGAKPHLMITDPLESLYCLGEYSDSAGSIAHREGIQREQS